MEAIIEFFSLIFSYIGAINVNAFSSVCYWFSSNFTMLAAIGIFILLAVMEIKESEEKYVNDDRNIY